MTVLEKQKEQLLNAKDLQNKEETNKPVCKDDLRIQLKRALEADDLCYNCETGFHYMRQ